jgi:hypothetical protein
MLDCDWSSDVCSSDLEKKEKEKGKEDSKADDRSAALSQLKDDLEKMARVLRIQSAGAGDEESLLVLSVGALKHEDFKKIADKIGWEVVIK